MASLVDRIRSWAKSDLRYWEQLALEKIASGVDSKEEHIRELVEAFFLDAGIAEVPRKPLNFPIETTSEAPPKKHQLERIFDLQNVNALPQGQEMRFGPHLTLIYGGNGAGKTGYARPLACAAFARGEREVLPNAALPKPKEPPSAKIELSCDGTMQTVTWIEGQRVPELAGFYAFDANSLKAHLTQANSLQFTPATLALLARLAELTDEVRSRVKEQIAQWERPSDFGPWFEGQSDVSQKIANLTANTAIDELKSLASLTPSEAVKMERLDEEIAQIKSQNSAKRLTDSKQELQALRDLITAIQTAESALGQKAVKDADSLVATRNQARADAEQMGAGQFKTESLTQVGSALWLQFVKAAKALADAEALRREPYPTGTDACLLCQQPLSSTAVDLIQRVWKFLESDVQERVSAAEKACSDKIRSLEVIKLDHFAGDSLARRLLAAELPLLAQSIDAQKEAFIARRRDLIRRLQSVTVPVAPPIEVSLIDIESLIRIKEADAAALEKTDANERLKQCISELRTLKHRQTLNSRMPEVTTYVSQLKRAARARQCLGSTRKITDKHTELFAELVTDRYLKEFGTCLRSFKTNLNVTVETRGHKGERVRQIALSRTAFAATYPAERVLSEGEKTAVAIADFLTESDLDENSAAIILDDPITSLDNEWKNVLAERLAERSKTKQVIVFTHDLAFAYHLNKHAEENGISVSTHWIQESEGHPGFVYADNSPICEKDFKSAEVARQWHRKAKDAPPQEQQHCLQQGFGALRTSYEALIIFELFKNVVARFEERISFDRLKDVHIEASDVSEIVDRMSALSRYIDAHLHSDNFAPSKPTPQLLNEEIENFDKIKRRIRSRAKARATVASNPPDSGHTADPAK